MSEIPSTPPHEPPSSHYRAACEESAFRGSASIECPDCKGENPKCVIHVTGFGPNAGLARYSPLGTTLSEIEDAHAACDGPVSRAGTDGPRPLAERVSALRQMLLAKTPGATGEFPDGKINPEDEGELRLAVGHDQDNVRIEFGKQVAWLAMPRADAVEFARAVMRHAVQLQE